jgi:ribose/xylose/arabinose/galactoside ABC-type transport system permease subunit
MPALLKGPSRAEFVVGNILTLLLALLVVFFVTQTDAFLTVANVKVLLSNEAALGVLSAALALLVIAGHVDLSVGSTIGFAGLITALASTEWSLPLVPAVLAGVAAGALVGTVNGLLCGVLSFNPIIVTLGMLGVVRGATLLIHQDSISGLPSGFATISDGEVAGIPILVLFGVAAFVLAAVFLSLTRWGRYAYAIGVSRDAAFLSALPVRSLPFSLYVLTGAAAGLAGVLLSARIGGASPGDEGLQMELQALTVILLGGVAFDGGRGRVFGVFVAWVFLAVLQNGLVLMNVTPYVEMVASGMALVLAAALDTFGTLLGNRLAGARKLSGRTDDAVRPSAARS